MKHHWSVKLLALMLAVVSAMTLAVSGLSVLTNLRYNSYGSDVSLEDKISDMTEQTVENYVYQAAMAAAVSYVKKQNTTPGSVERELWISSYNYTWHDRGIWPEYEYTISENGLKLESTAKDTKYARNELTTVYVEDGKITNLGSALKDFPEYDMMPLDYVWESYNGRKIDPLDDRTVYYELIYAEPNNVYRLERFNDVGLQVLIHLTEADLSALESQITGMAVMKEAYSFRNVDILTAAVSAAVLICSAGYACLAAGKGVNGEVKPRGTNALPLDLFAVAACFVGYFPLALGLNAGDSAFHSTRESLYIQVFAFAALMAVTVLLCLLLLMALCAQVRMGSGAWLKRTVVGRCGRGVWNFFKGLWLKLWGKITASDLTGKAVSQLPTVKTWIKGVYKNLPLTAQWLMLYGGLFVVTLWVSHTFRNHDGYAFLLVGVVGFFIVLYTSYGFGKLRDAAKRMSEGDLDTKISCYNDSLYGSFAEFAEDLNHLGDTCVEAAMEKMKSERMKSELITNVSHDIKTPLTSIINYVDLLQRSETEEQRKEYLEVLERQSQRLKKLIEDLMEMSKASSGNISVELAETDVVEAVNQALGEFADRFESLALNVVFRQSEQVITANCDGKLLWRVMSNILGNVVKYALPGTRVYVDVVQENNKVYLSVKNISRDPLNIPAEELMERFVRGDESRNDQGNGLGLNIAKSLMEVQHGDLSLTVDGDLFKVILTMNAKM